MPGPKVLLTRMLTRDLFALANLVVVSAVKQEQKERVSGGPDWSEPRTAGSQPSEEAADGCGGHPTRRDPAVESRILGNLRNTQQVRCNTRLNSSCMMTMMLC